VETPETRYTRSGQVHIAYQVVGRGPLDLVLLPGAFSHIEHQWEEPSFARFLHRLASFSRLIVLDVRGTGLSDRWKELPTLEEQIDDVLAVWMRWSPKRRLCSPCLREAPWRRCLQRRTRGGRLRSFCSARMPASSGPRNIRGGEPLRSTRPCCALPMTVGVPEGSCRSSLRLRQATRRSRGGSPDWRDFSLARVRISRC